MGCCQSRVKEVEKETTDSKHLPSIMGEEEKMEEHIQPEAASPTPLSNHQIDQPNSEHPILPNEKIVERPIKKFDKNQIQKSPDTLITKREKPSTSFGIPIEKNSVLSDIQKEKSSVSFNMTKEKPTTTFGIPKEKPSVSIDTEKENSLVSFNMIKEKPSTTFGILKEKPSLLIDKHKEISSVSFDLGKEVNKNNVIVNV
jgi:hypothetical protein